MAQDSSKIHPFSSTSPGLSRDQLFEVDYDDVAGEAMCDKSRTDRQVIRGALPEGSLQLDCARKSSDEG
jgi:hypothetical protein